MKFVVCLLVICVVKCDERGARVRRIVGGVPAEAPPEDDPVVFTRFSGRTARVLGVRDFPHYVFRGVRFAYAPVGKDRFVRPRQYFLEGFENATEFAPPCVQPVPAENRVIGNEDCLFLNVFTPTLPTGLEGLPVVVWIHGGGFRYGSASQYGVRRLVGKQVVVVTIQYRLGSLGFLSTGTKSLPGNAALFDMALAVQWTRNYIGFFGGNPNRITVMGHGTGASSAIMVALSNIAKGLTSRVIAMSGSSLSQFANDDKPKSTAHEVADANGCPVNSELTMIRCLQNLSPAAIIKVDSYIEFNRIRDRGFISGLNGKLGSAPVYEGRRDGRSLPPVTEAEPISDPDAAHKKIPLLTGITKDETKRACEGQFKNDIVSALDDVGGLLDKLLLNNLKNALNVLPLRSLLPLDRLPLDALPVGGLISGPPGRVPPSGGRHRGRRSQGLLGGGPQGGGLLGGGSQGGGLLGGGGAGGGLLPVDGLPLVGNQSGGLLGLLDTDLLKNYLNIEGLNLHEVLGKVSEVTGDVLFNVPAFLTAQGWTKQDAPSFLYSFEHAGKRQKSSSFLKGLPLVGNTTQKDESDDVVAHGDELAYIFDPQDLHGKSLDSDEEVNEEDEKVGDIFTQMVADFARSGKPTLEGQDVEPFSITGNNFIQIGTKPMVATNFRFCEMGLWIGLADRLKTSTCSLLQMVQKVPGGLLNTVGGGRGGGGRRAPANIAGGNKGRSSGLFGGLG